MLFQTKHSHFQKTERMIKGTAVIIISSLLSCGFFNTLKENTNLAIGIIYFIVIFSLFVILNVIIFFTWRKENTEYHKREQLNDEL